VPLPRFWLAVDTERRHGILRHASGYTISSADRFDGYWPGSPGIGRGVGRARQCRWQRCLSGPRNDETEPPPAEGDVNSFDGTWLFAGIGCHSSGVLAAIISHGKIIVQGGSGRVDPDGTLNSIGAANGVTQTAVGRLTGNAGTGTYKRSDGCRGTWTAIKQ
jgi:hypothetical protein